MANLSEVAQWENDVFQLETTNLALGGPDGDLNIQPKQLANRTAYLKQELELRAPVDSPSFTGTPEAPTPSMGNDSNRLATTAFVAQAIAALLNAPPSTLDTLNELAAALGDDPNFAATVTTQLGLKANTASPALTGTPTAPTAAPGTDSTQLATTAFVSAAMSALEQVPAGIVLPFTGTYLPAGWVRGNGTLLSRAAYPALTTHALASGAIVSDAAWLAGDTGKYSDGDGSTTIRVPLLGGEFLRALDEGRGVDAGRAIGTMQKGTGIPLDSNGTNSPYVTQLHSQFLSAGDSALVAERIGVDLADAATYPDTASAWIPPDGFGGFGFGTTRPRNIAYPFIIKA